MSKLQIVSGRLLSVLLATLFLAACGDDETGHSKRSPKAVLEVGAAELSFDLEVGETGASQLMLTNSGSKSLEFELEVDAEWLTVSPVSGEIAAGSSAEVAVSVTCPAGPGELSAAVTIASNDAASPHLLNVALNCRPLAQGDLQLRVQGLPDGVDAAIEIAGPESFSAQATTSQLFEGLALGTYTVSAATVGDETRYVPGPTETSVDVVTEALAEVTITYELVLGGVEVAVTGLPDHLEAALTLTRDEQDWAVPANGRVDDLEPGRYTVHPAEVADGQSLYQASQADVVVVSGEVASVTINYILDGGALLVTVEGLPEDLDHDIELVDAEGNVTSLPQSGELAALEPGEYELVPANVYEWLSEYEAPSATVVITSRETTEVTITYELILASLAVEIVGLDGLDAAVTMVGEGATINITESGTVEGITPGDYVVTVGDVEDLPARYAGTTPQGEVSLRSGPANGLMVVTYTLIRVDLDVIIVGLNGTPANVRIQGPQFDETVTANAALTDLLPGEYTVIVEDVEALPARYTGTASWTTQVVESGDSATLVVTYAVVPGDLSIEITGLDGLDADVRIQGPQFDETVTGSAAFPDVLPGQYTVTVNPVVDGPATYEGQGSTLTLESNGSETFAVNYERITGALQVIVTGLPNNLPPDIRVTGDGFDEQHGSPNFTISEMNPGNYTVEFGDVELNNVIYRVENPTTNVMVTRDNTVQTTAAYVVVPGEIQFTVETFGTVSFVLVLSGPNGPQPITETATLEDMPPGFYTLSLSSVSEDNLGNEGHVSFDLQNFTLGSEVLAINVTAAAGTMVFTEANTGPGSLRHVIGSVVSGSTVEFAESVATIRLDGQIAIDKSLNIMGRQDASVVLDAEGNSRFFNVLADHSLALYGLTLKNGDFFQNGGAINVAGNAELRVERSIFEDNHSDARGGAIFLANGGSLHVLESIFIRNTATTSGGAISTPETLTVTAEALIESSLFADNSANLGGAVYLSGNGHVLESTFGGNSAGDIGGGLYLWAGRLTVLGNTFTHNTAASRSGGIHFWGDNLTTMPIGRSIVAGNTSPIEADIGRTGTSATPQTLGYNAIGVTAAGFADGVEGDRVGSDGSPLDAGLEVLADNGGFSETMALQLTSPAYALVPADRCEAMGELELPVLDQRRVRRPAGAYCNAGAWELEALLETFSNAAMSAASYTSGEFVGDNNVTWQYTRVRRNTGDHVIEGTSIIFQDNGANITSSTIQGGISSLSLQMKQAFTGATGRRLEVYINGQLKATSPLFNDSNQDPKPVYRFIVEDIDVDGEFDIEIRNLGAQLVIDNVTWR